MLKLFPLPFPKTHRSKPLQSYAPASLFVIATCAFLSFCYNLPIAKATEIEAGIAQVEITPPHGFPMAGYYHERLATDTANPLWAKAVVFRQGNTQAAWMVCDLTGVAVDLSTEIRRRASEQTGIPYESIVITASHSHTAPDYYRSLYWHLGPKEEIPDSISRERAAYTATLIERAVQALVQAHTQMQPVLLSSGSAIQEKPVSFCRRFLMKDGSVRTWVGLKHADSLHATAPIDPRMGVLRIDQSSGKPLGVLSQFALHLDTVGGLLWHADYPYFIGESVKQSLGNHVISIFGTGACGDINHADPTGAPRLKTQEIGESLGATLVSAFPKLKPIEQPLLQVKTAVVPLTLEKVTEQQAKQSLVKVKAIAAGEKADFLDHVIAKKRLVLDHLIRGKSTPEALAHIGLGATRTWQGIGHSIPTEVTVLTFGVDTALVFLPGEIFAELGLAIQKASPFKHTNVITFSQCVEMIYIPNRHAYAGGGYEVANSLVAPGSGEALVEAATTLLREAATQVINK